MKLQSEHDIEEVLKTYESKVEILKKKLKDHLNSDKVSIGYILRIADEIGSASTEINTLRWVLVRNVAPN
jgi:hypothetical protein